MALVHRWRVVEGDGVLTAVFYGLLASSGFFVGVTVGLLTAPPRRLVASIMAFGGGVLVAALNFDLHDGHAAGTRS